VREVIGTNDLSSIMPDQLTQTEVETKGATPAAAPVAAAPTAPAADLAAQAMTVLQATLDRYDTGLIVSQVLFQNVRPPQEVKEAFDDAISAREDRQRSSNQADAYSKRVIPEARGDAARILAESQGYNSERIAKAQGESERFNLIASEYKLAPEVTRKRLYIETMQQVLKESSKVIDFSGGKNILYLPLDANRGNPPQTVEAIAPTLATPEPGKGAH